MALINLYSDAPAHHLFVLLPPQSPTSKTLPEPLVVIQIALEGSLSRSSTLASLQKGVRSNGDLIPWVMTQQFQDESFSELNGARVVRIATSPECVGMGYGARAMELLEKYYRGDIETTLDEDDNEAVQELPRISDDALQKVCIIFFPL
jgi:N-acetyltransferase 10